MCALRLDNDEVCDKKKQRRRLILYVNTQNYSGFKNNELIDNVLNIHLCMCASMHFSIIF